jgi:hypothetical protein
MYVYVLVLLISWTNPGPIVNVDGHDLSVDTTATHVRVHGFTTLAACQAYQLTLPVTLNGSPFAYQITGRSCQKELAGTTS